jgi:hypothetical protein
MTRSSVLVGPESAREHVSNALTMLELCAWKSVETEQVWFPLEDFAAICIRLRQAMKVLEGGKP